MFNFRRKLFIYPEVQKPFLMQILIGSAMLSLLQSLLIYAVLSWMSYKAQVDLSIIVDYRILEVWKYGLYLAVFIPLIFNILIGIYILLYFTNKFAGPLFRLERELDRFLNNETTQLEVHFRQNDYLKSLATKVNSLTVKK